MKAFLSSTFDDLVEHRGAATEALERLDQQVGRMEIFGAQPVEPESACFREIEESDLFVGIYAHRYGYVPVDQDVSITELEFDHAQNLSKPTFCFLVRDDHPWPRGMFEDEPGRTKLVNFKHRIGNALVRETFTTPENLAFKVAASVGRYLAQTQSLARLRQVADYFDSIGGCLGGIADELQAGRFPSRGKGELDYIAQTFSSIVQDLRCCQECDTMIEHQVQFFLTVKEYLEALEKSPTRLKDLRRGLRLSGVLEQCIPEYRNIDTKTLSSLRTMEGNYHAGATHYRAMREMPGRGALCGKA